MQNIFSLLRGKRCCRALFTTVLVCLDHDSLLELDPFCYNPVDVNVGGFGRLFPVVHDQFLCLAQVDGEVVVLAPHCQVSDPLPIVCHIIFGDLLCRQQT